MDCTRIGESPPTSTQPTAIFLEVRRSASMVICCNCRRAR
jgi:hypothetical protein